MNASRSTERWKFNAAVEPLAAPALPMFPAWIFPPGPRLLNAAGGWAGWVVVTGAFNGTFFFSLLSSSVCPTSSAWGPNRLRRWHQCRIRSKSSLHFNRS